MSKGTIKKVAGPLVIAEGMRDANMFDVVRVSNQRLIGEIIEMHGDEASIQVYEETSGLGPGEPVESTEAPLSVELGPGLITSIYDGIQRPLDDIMKISGTNLKRGVEVPSLKRNLKWNFVPAVKAGDEVEAGDILGTVQETIVVNHKIMVPYGVKGTVKEIKAAPGTTEINGVLRTIAGEAAFVQHIAVFLTFRCGSGGGEAVDVAANIEGMDLTMIEIRGRASENKVYLALDIAVPIILSAIFTGRKFFRTVEAAGGKFFCRKRSGEQRVLPAEEAAVIEKQAISIGIDCQTLTGAVAGSAIILESQIAGGEVMGVSAERRGSEGAALAVRKHLFCTIAPDDDSLIGRVTGTHEGKVGLFYHNLFPINAGSNVDRDGIAPVLGGIDQRFADRRTAASSLGRKSEGRDIDFVFRHDILHSGAL